MTNRDKILEISKNLKLSHIGSCLSVLPILEEIYDNKKPNDLVLMDNAHAHLAHLVVRASLLTDREIVQEVAVIDQIETHGIHCERRAGCDACGGSLGHAIGISIGMVLANPDIKVHVTVSDGSMMEGSNWEALRIKKELNLNIQIYANFNGFSAVAKVNLERLVHRMRTFDTGIKVYFTENGEGFDGVGGHYKVL